MLINIFGKSKAELKEEVRDFKEQNTYLNNQLTQANDRGASVQILLDRKETGFRILEENMLSEHALDIARMRNEGRLESLNAVNELEIENKNLEKQIEVLESELDENVALKETELEKEFNKRVVSLEKEAKQTLDADRAALRKELKAEFGEGSKAQDKKILELSEENGELRGENTGLKGTVKVLEAQLGSMGGVADKILGALPEVSAHITTPQQVIAPAAKQENKGGENKKPQ